MALGTAGFKPGKGDLVKVLSDKYPIPKGTIASITSILRSGTHYSIEGYEDVVIDKADLEVVAYKNDGTKFS